MQMTEPSEAIFVLVNDIAVFVAKQKKNIVVSPFKIQEIRDLVLAENVPSACTL